MARPLRIEFAGALYHVMSRGNDRQPIVADDKDRTRRIEWLRKTVECYGWKLHAFVLMLNHDHLFVETPDPNLSAGMQYLNGCYTSYFNRRHDRVGHLFQGRYKAQLVEKERHYLEVSRYIHLNPVRAGLTERPEDWPWSSYSGYHDANQILSWVTYARVLGEFRSKATTARARYRRFVRRGLQGDCDSPWNNATEDLIVGSREFVEEVRRMIDPDESAQAVPQLNHLRDGVELHMVIKAVAEELGSDPSDWLRGRKIRNNARAVAAYLARRRYGYSPSIIARAVGYSNPCSVSLAVRKIGMAKHQYRSAVARIEARIASQQP